jgi:thiamine biosynthesis lipoprotein ApbE
MRAKLRLAKDRRLIRLSALVIAATLGAPRVAWRASAATLTSDQVYTAHYENVLGTSFEIKTLAASETDSSKAESAALAEVDREAKILSSWDDASEFSKWFRTQNQAVPVSPELFEVLQLFDQWRSRTGGALDASAEAITRVWQKAATEKRLPTQAELDAAVGAVQKQHWALDPANRTATHTSDTPLAMNSFVKSYIIGHAVDRAIRVPGVRGVEVNIGGDLVVRGDWNGQVDVADPRADAENAPPITRLSVRDRAVATSGDYRRGVEINGQHYSHIVDPRTGQPADEVISSTVIAPVPSTAGALATAFSVMAPEQSERLAASVPGVEYMLVERDGKIVESNGWSAFEVPDREPVLAQRPAEPALKLVSEETKPVEWTSGYVLTVGLQVALQNEFRARRPYLAVWIIDGQDWHPVRTLAVWYDKYRFLLELNEWYGTVFASNSKRGMQLLNTVSSATRPPGSYTFQWDGKDDSGKLVRPGKYVVYIEAAREHGTHQLIKQEMIFNGAPQKLNLPGGMEIASAYLDYHQISH